MSTNRSLRCRLFSLVKHDEWCDVLNDPSRTVEEEVTEAEAKRDHMAADGEMLPDYQSYSMVSMLIETSTDNVVHDNFGRRRGDHDGNCSQHCSDL